MKRHSTPLFLVVALLLNGVSLAFSATQLATNTLGELVVSDANGKTIKNLAPGNVGEIIHDGSNAFKISYGKDLQGNFTAIIYADPSNAQTVELSYQGKNITLSKQAVLTLVFDSNGIILKSGVLGQVVVDNEAMKPSSNLRISNSGTIMASETPIIPIPPTPVQIPIAAEPAPTTQPQDTTANPITDQNGKNYGYVSGPDYGNSSYGTSPGLIDSFAQTNDYGYQDGKQVGYPTYLQNKINPQLEDAIQRAQTPYRPRLNPDPITPVNP